MNVSERRSFGSDGRGRLFGPGRFVFLAPCAGASISEEFGVHRDATHTEDDIPADGKHDRAIRAARNQALFRAVNEKIRGVNDDFGELTGTFTVACECADSCCFEMLELPIDVYEHVRESPYRFVVLPGHVDPLVEDVVAEEDTFTVVEMTGPEVRELLVQTAAAPPQPGEGV